MSDAQSPGPGASPARRPGGSPRPTPSAPANTRAGRLGRAEETSAGGLVVDRNARVPRAALIARRDRRGRLVWSLPKGHIEAGETATEAAIREVAEETGITGRVLAPLGTIDFWFIAESTRVHKTVHHFLLEAYEGDLSDEDIEVVEVRWFDLDEVADTLAYPDERRLLAQVPALLAQAG